MILEVAKPQRGLARVFHWVLSYLVKIFLYSKVLYSIFDMAHLFLYSKIKKILKMCKMCISAILKYERTLHITSYFDDNVFVLVFIIKILKVIITKQIEKRIKIFVQKKKKKINNCRNSLILHVIKTEIYNII